MNITHEKCPGAVPQAILTVKIMADNRTCTRRAQTDSISVGGAGGIAFVTGFSGDRISNLSSFCA